MRLIVWDWNAVEKHSFDGECNITNLHTLLQPNQTVDNWYPLTEKVKNIYL